MSHTEFLLKFQTWTAKIQIELIFSCSFLIFYFSVFFFIFLLFLCWSDAASAMLLFAFVFLFFHLFFSLKKCLKNRGRYVSSNWTACRHFDMCVRTMEKVKQLDLTHFSFLDSFSTLRVNISDFDSSDHDSYNINFNSNNNNLHRRFFSSPKQQFFVLFQFVCIFFKFFFEFFSFFLL